VLPPRLEAEIEQLKQAFQIQVAEDPQFVNLIFKEFPLGSAYNLDSSDLLLRVPRTYPEAGPDMFWVDERLLLKDGRVPQAADSFETYLDRRWRRFSWHRSAWNPSFDNMHSHIEFIRKRINEQR